MKITNRQHWRASEEMQARARNFRRAMTPAEKKLWQHIRNGQLNEAYFRRQYAVGPYIVDFLCDKAKLVIEVDGDDHADGKQAKYDAERTEWLCEQKGYRVIRFWNNKILENIEGVLLAIQVELTNQSSDYRATHV